MNRKKPLLETFARIGGKLNEFRTESGLNETILLKIGNDYSVFDPGDGDWREDMEYLGYAKNMHAHFFRAFGSPGSKEIVIMEVPKSREMKDIM